MSGMIGGTDSERVRQLQAEVEQLRSTVRELRQINVEPGISLGKAHDWRQRCEALEADERRWNAVELRGLTIESRRSVSPSVDPWMVRESTDTHKAMTYWTGKTAREALDAAISAQPHAQSNGGDASKAGDAKEPRT